MGFVELLAEQLADFDFLRHDDLACVTGSQTLRLHAKLEPDRNVDICVLPGAGHSCVEMEFDCGGHHCRIWSFPTDRLFLESELGDVSKADPSDLFHFVAYLPVWDPSWRYGAWLSRLRNEADFRSLAAPFSCRLAKLCRHGEFPHLGQWCMDRVVSLDQGQFPSVLAQYEKKSNSTVLLEWVGFIRTVPGVLVSKRFLKWRDKLLPKMVGAGRRDAALVMSDQLNVIRRYAQACGAWDDDSLVRLVSKMKQLPEYLLPVE